MGSEKQPALASEVQFTTEGIFDINGKFIPTGDFPFVSLDPTAPYVYLPARPLRDEDKGAWTDLKPAQYRRHRGYVSGSTRDDGAHRYRLQRLGTKKAAWEALGAEEREIAVSVLKGLEMIERSLAVTLDRDQDAVGKAARDLVRRFNNLVVRERRNPAGYKKIVDRSYGREPAVALRKKLIELLKAIKADARRWQNRDVFEDRGWCEAALDVVNGFLLAQGYEGECELSDVQIELKNKAPSKVAAALVKELVPAASIYVAEGRRKEARSRRPV